MRVNLCHSSHSTEYSFMYSYLSDRRCQNSRSYKLLPSNPRHTPLQRQTIANDINYTRKTIIFASIQSRIYFDLNDVCKISGVTTTSKKATG